MLIRTDEKITINSDNITGILVEKTKNDRWAIIIYDTIGCRHIMHTYTSEDKADEALFFLEHWLAKPPVDDVIIEARLLTSKKFRVFRQIGFYRKKKKAAELFELQEGLTVDNVQDEISRLTKEIEDAEEKVMQPEEKPEE